MCINSIRGLSIPTFKKKKKKLPINVILRRRIVFRLRTCPKIDCYFTGTMQNVQHVSRILWSVSTTVRKKNRKNNRPLRPVLKLTATYWNYWKSTVHVTNILQSRMVHFKLLFFIYFWHLKIISVRNKEQKNPSETSTA